MGWLVKQTQKKDHKVIGRLSALFVMSNSISHRSKWTVKVYTNWFPLFIVTHAGFYTIPSYQVRMDVVVIRLKNY